MNEKPTIGQTNINQLVAMYRSQVRFGTGLDKFLDRMEKAWPEWNIKPNHTNLYNYINARCGDFSNPESRSCPPKEEPKDEPQHISSALKKVIEQFGIDVNQEKG